MNKPGDSTFVVTGAAGFIGSHLCEYLVAKGLSVVGIDNLSSGTNKNLETLADSERFDFVHDSVNPDVLENIEIPPGATVIHLAAIADVVPSISDPLSYMATNVQGTALTLELARKIQASHFIYAASSSCYGIPDEFPTTEDAAVKPMYPYAFSKWIGELTVMHWSQVYGIPVASLRFFNVIGPRVRAGSSYGAVLGVFAGQKIAGLPLTIIGDGEQKRDFLDVRDLVRGIALAGAHKVEGIFNLCSSSPRSILDLARLISVNWEFIPDRPGEPRITHGDASKFRQVTGWAPEFDLEATVKFAFSEPNTWEGSRAWTSEDIATSTRDWFRHLA